MSEVLDRLDGDLKRPTRAIRPQPIRDAILRFMTQPRSAGEIADHIDRPVPTTTGHLRAMIKLGLVRRIAFATYAPGSYRGPQVRLPQRRSESTSELRGQLTALLAEPHSLEHLHQKTGVPVQVVHRALRDLWLSGLIAGSEKDGFRLVRWKKKNI